MPILLLPPRYTQDSIALWRAAIADGWEVERLHGWQVPERLAEMEAIPYGETIFAGFVAERLSLALMEPPLDWLTTVPSPFLRRSVRFTTLREAREETGPAFIKPADDKCFPAQVYASGAALPTPEGVPETTPVLIAQPVVWEAEFRCFVREGAVTTLSPYWRTTGLAQAEDGSWPAAPEETEEASAFAAAVLERVPMPPGVVLDIGRIAGQGWAVVEANPAWASGLYGCDPAAVLPVLRRAATPRNPLLQQDLRWTVDRADNSTG